MLINPRLTDFYGIQCAQEQIDFAIPFFNEDIPLYLDPFLLWKSPAMQDNALHTSLMTFFNDLGAQFLAGKKDHAINNLILASECHEVKMGTSLSGKGRRISKKLAEEILETFDIAERAGVHGFRHLEAIQLLVRGISKDRISDIACSFIKSHLIDYTITQCYSLGIPTEKVHVNNVFHMQKPHPVSEQVPLPITPESREPIILVPKRYLRFVPWINFDEYYAKSCPQDDGVQQPEELSRISVLNFNRDNYGAIQEYIALKERTAEDCKNDPLFSAIPALSAKRRLKQLLALPSGTQDLSHQKYEKMVESLFPSMFYPYLDFAAAQSRTDSGTSIRDLIFYNTASHHFLKQIHDTYKSQQIVMELKNVHELSREHVDQLNRYMTNELGQFGILVTRNEPTRAIRQRILDLWSGQRKCIVIITDSDIEQMVDVFETKQREPIDVLVKKYVEFQRSWPC